MSAIGSQYRIHRHEPVCAATGRPLEPGQSVIAALVENPEDGTFDRRDYDPDAWSAGPRPDHLFAFWSSTVRAPTEAPSPVIGEDEAIEMFESGGAEGGAEGGALDTRVRFVLALLLIRRKRLVYLGSTQTDEGRVMRVRAAGRADEGLPELEVLDPGLGDEDLEPIALQLGRLLGDEQES